MVRCGLRSNDFAVRFAVKWKLRSAGKSLDGELQFTGSLCSICPPLDGETPGEFPGNAPARPVRRELLVTRRSATKVPERWSARAGLPCARPNADEAGSISCCDRRWKG